MPPMRQNNNSELSYDAKLSCFSESSIRPYKSSSQRHAKFSLVSIYGNEGTDWSALSRSRLLFFFSTSNRHLNFKSRLVFSLSTDILQVSTDIFYYLRCILQYSTYVLCFSTCFYHLYVFVRNGTP